MKKIIILVIVLLLLGTSKILNAQDYSRSLEGISKVIVRAATTIRLKPHGKNTLLIKESENYKDTTIEKAKGLKEISNNGIANTDYGIEILEEGTVLKINGLRERREADLEIYLPNTMNISAESLANNDIIMDGFSSEIEVINHLGSIMLVNVTGPIVAENDNGDIAIIFSKLNQISPMSILTSNGDIDITMPQNTDARIISKTLRGSFYTDFDLYIENENSLTDRRTVRATLNNGGVSISLQNLKGNIYLRKPK